MNTSNLKETCNIVVLYDGDVTRARAMTACDFLVKQFWEHVELNFNWWRADFLSDPHLANAAALDAIEADFLIICSDQRGQPTPSLERWFESWVERRGDRLGALVDLTVTPASQTFGLTETRQRFFRDVCQRGSFDYLTTLAEAGPEFNTPSSTPREMNGIIDDILGDSRPPSHYGLNE
ncbi:MAG: hypothetical protein QM813_10370 [Verrucomicrobiota bacterium]